MRAASFSSCSAVPPTTPFTLRVSSWLPQDTILSASTPTFTETAKCAWAFWGKAYFSIYSPLFDQIKPKGISILSETLPLITFHRTNIFFWIAVERGQVPHGVLPRAFHLSSSPSSPWWQRTHTIMNRALSRYGCGLQPWIAHTITTIL